VLGGLGIVLVNFREARMVLTTLLVFIATIL